MGNFSDVVYYSLLAAYGRMISNPVTILFMSHVKTAHQSAQLKKLNIKVLVASHMEDLEKLPRKLSYFNS